MLIKVRQLLLLTTPGKLIQNARYKSQTLTTKAFSLRFIHSATLDTNINFCKQQDSDHKKELHVGQTLNEAQTLGQIQPERKRYPGHDDFVTWENKLDFPLNVSESIKRGEPIPQIKLKHIGLCSIIGRRKENQDRIVAAEIKENLLYFGVFDGHGGTWVSEYVAKNMQGQIEKSLKNSSDLQWVLKEAFEEINDKLTDHIAHKVKDKDAIYSGTTATVGLLRNSVELVVGHVGDSRAILSRKAQAMSLTKDHDPEIEAEVKRIETQGGHIATDSLGRSMVNGMLAMTRSIGDIHLKPFGVTSVPDTRSIGVRHSRDGFVVLLSDGITFIMNDQEIINTISNCHDPTEGATRLTEAAIQFGAEDNCSCVIVPFGSWGKFADQAVPFSFSRGGVTTRNL